LAIVIAHLFDKVPRPVYDKQRTSSLVATCYNLSNHSKVDASR